MPDTTALSEAPHGTRFRMLASMIRRDIDRGTLPVGSRLPAVPELAKAHGVGVNTVRRAVARLVEDGLLDRRHGSGTYVLRTSADRQVRRAVGVLVPSLTYYYPQVIAGIEEAASRRGVDVVIACSYYDADRELAEIDRFLGSSVDGMLLVPSLHRAPDPARYVSRLSKLPVPYFLIERRLDDPAADAADSTDVSSVRTDIAAGVRAAIAHLTALGRRRIGHIGHLSSAPGTRVFRGFLDAMREFGLEVIDGAVLRRPTLSMAEVGQYVTTCAREQLDAVFCLGDPFAATLVRELGKHGHPVPDDVAVITFDDEFAHVAEVPLTAVSPPKYELGRLATDLLVRRLEDGGPAVACDVRLQPKLVIRSSCGARPTETIDLVFEPTG
ncbi:substrate-binding domain-containing protein [Phytoactinopolyspora halotolerans]|uniref:LacI family transcriptional regulator n=1 Tax=Phytoactinopolyspora halotolerans TaxID=1981512 RepID=A0A6L9SAV6_9ACTN|nr:GntR family transcriptional regulator [Phytoactinopolyspora halotolerans]NEE02229.1 LacI family transcriptional regulator [Phytoactinopolyspora halotolerans]